MGVRRERREQDAQQASAHPPPASAAWVSARASLLGLCNTRTWQPGEQRRGGKGERGGGAGVMVVVVVVGFAASGWAPSERFLEGQPSSCPQLPPQFPLTLLSVPLALVGCLWFWMGFPLEL